MRKRWVNVCLQMSPNNYRCRAYGRIFCGRILWKTLWMWRGESVYRWVIGHISSYLRQYVSDGVRYPLHLTDDHRPLLWPPSGRQPR